MPCEEAPIRTHLVPQTDVHPKIRIQSPLHIFSRFVLKPMNISLQMSRLHPLCYTPSRTDTKSTSPSRFHPKYPYHTTKTHTIICKNTQQLYEEKPQDVIQKYKQNRKTCLPDSHFRRKELEQTLFYCTFGIIKTFASSHKDQTR